MSGAGERGARGAPERIVATTRIAAVALAAGPVVALGAALVVPAPRSSRALAAPAALAGIVALAIGFRVYRAALGRVAPGADRAARLGAVRAGTIGGLAVTGAAALLGVIAFHLSREPFALAGVAAHLILAGAAWPTRARVEDPSPGSAESSSGTGDS